MCIRDRFDGERDAVGMGGDFADAIRGLAEPPVPPGIQGLDVGYCSMKATLQKSLSALSSPGDSCAVCHHAVHPDKHQLLVCSSETCRSIFHMACLGQHFLSKPHANHIILPRIGSCPTCKAQLSWSQLVRDLSLRTRGAKETAELFRERRRKKSDIGESAIAEVAETLTEGEEADEGDHDEDLDATGFRLPKLQDDDQAVSEDDWRPIDDVEEGEAHLSNVKLRRPGSARKAAKKPSERVVEDSDWDEAEVLD